MCKFGFAKFAFKFYEFGRGIWVKFSRTAGIFLTRREFLVKFSRVAGAFKFSEFLVKFNRSAVASKKPKFKQNLAKFRVNLAFLRLFGFIALNLGFVSQIYAAKVEVSAENFASRDNESILSGNVVVKREKDILRSKSLKILTNKDHKATKYIATGDARFELRLGDKDYKGSGNELTYDAVNDSYEIEGNAIIEEITTNKRLSGKKIIIDRKKEVYNVFSDEQKPVKFVFELDEKGGVK